MKKIFTVTTILLLSLILISCTDSKTIDDSISVHFFTTASATTIAPYRNIEANSIIEEPEEPYRSGFRFDGWYTDVNTTQPWDFSTDRVTSSMVLFAKWGPGYFRVEYVLNGGTMPSTFIPLEDYPEDQRDPETNPALLGDLFFTIGLNNVLKRPTRPGYTFKNFYLYDEFQWEGAPEGTTQSYKPGDGGFNSLPSQLAQDLVLYAHWDPIRMSVTFRSNYPGTENVPNTYYRSRTLTFGFDFIYDSNFDQQPDVNRLPDFLNFDSNGLLYEDLSYEFIGWNDRADGTGNWYGDGTGNPTESTSLTTEFLFTLHAQWKPKDA